MTNPTDEIGMHRLTRRFHRKLSRGRVASDALAPEPLTGRRGFLAGGMIAGVALTTAGRAARTMRQAGDPMPLQIAAMPTQHPQTEAVAHLPHVDLWYFDTGGTGQPVVLLHPLTGSGHVWGYQQPVLAGAGYRVIGYSRRGFRGSSPGGSDEGTGVDDLRALADHLGLDRFHAVGTAGGAFVAAAFAVAAPGRLRSLTLACSILLARIGEVSTLLGGLAARGFDTMPPEFRELGPSYRALTPSGVARWRALEEQSRGGNPPVNQPAGPPLTGQSLAALTVPTLLISGDADLIAPPPVARAFARTIPNSELHVLTECGHSAYWERPEAFNRVVIDFLGRHRR